MKTCTGCGKELPDYAMFCEECGGRAEAVTTNVVEETPAGFEQPPVEKKPKGWLRKLLIAAAVLCVLVVVGLFTNWFGLVSPLAKVGKSMMRTLKAESGTIVYSVKTTSEDYVSENVTEMRLVLDEEEKTYKAYIVTDRYTERNGDFSSSTSMYATDGDRGYSCTLRGDEVTWVNIVEEDTEEFFEQREKLFEKQEDVDWDDVLEELDLEDYLEADEMDDFIKDVAKKYLGNRRWLKKNMGYSRQGNTITFDVDPETFIEAVLDVVDESDVFTRKAKREIEDGLEAALDALDDTDLDIVFSFTTKGRYLSNIHLEMSGDIDGEEGKVEMDLTISDINKTDVSKTDIRKVKNLVKERLDEEGIEYTYCAICGEYGEICEYADGQICWDCYYEDRF